MATGITFETTDCAEQNVTHGRTGKRFFWVPETGLLREFGQSPKESIHCPCKRDVVTHVIARRAAYR